MLPYRTRAGKALSYDWLCLLVIRPPTACGPEPAADPLK